LFQAQIEDAKGPLSVAVGGSPPAYVKGGFDGDIQVDQGA
jgi:hypothetical protein